MNFELTEKQSRFQAAIRRYAQDTLKPTVADRLDDHATPHETIRQLARERMLGVNLPTSLGGSEVGPIALAVALREVAAVDASVAVTVAVTNMVGEVIAAFGTPAQAQTYVPQLASGAYFGGAFALSEPGAGSDAAALSTRADQRENGWVLNGQKMWITTGDEAGVAVVWARTGQPGHSGISCFLVEGGAPGLAAGNPEDKMGLWASHTVSLTLDSVEVPAEALLGQLGQGFKIAMAALNGGRINIGAQAVGIATAALEWAREHVKVVLEPSAHQTAHQACLPILADMATALDASWLLVLRAAWLKETKRSFGHAAAMAKVAASEACNRIVRQALDIAGLGGCRADALLSRLCRDARVTQIYEGTSEIQRMVIGREVLRQAGAH